MGFQFVSLKGSPGLKISLGTGELHRIWVSFSTSGLKRIERSEPFGLVPHCYPFYVFSQISILLCIFSRTTSQPFFNLTTDWSAQYDCSGEQKGLATWHQQYKLNEPGSQTGMTIAVRIRRYTCWSVSSMCVCRSKWVGSLQRELRYPRTPFKNLAKKSLVACFQNDCLELFHNWIIIFCPCSPCLSVHPIYGMDMRPVLLFY